MKNLFKHLKTTVSGVLVALLLLSFVPTTDFDVVQDVIDGIEEVSPCFQEDDWERS